ncbi:MAG: hypothetical protein HQK96_09770 [Nitrospirae bacterium]|nr:hypothetical protein [Nitrospirota bacterium]MBF0554824.1 hypothetical protein [Nitrospirota bacterium]
MNSYLVSVRLKNADVATLREEAKKLHIPISAVIRIRALSDSIGVVPRDSVSKRCQQEDSHGCGRTE